MSIRAYRDIHRRKSRQIMVGKVPVGGDAPITVQTMTNTITGDARATIDQIRGIEEAGCRYRARFLSRRGRHQGDEGDHQGRRHSGRGRHSFPLQARHRGGGERRRLPAHQSRQYRLAQRVREVVQAAKDHGCSMRIGVNAGSLEPDLLEKYGEPCPEAMVESALNHAKILDDLDFREYKISVKASDPFLAVAAYQALSEAIDCPAACRHHRSGRHDFRHGQILHRHGHAAVERHRRHHPRLAFRRSGGRGARRLRYPQIAEPAPSRRQHRLVPQSCARQGFNVIETVKTLEDRLKHIATPMSLSIIGCVVNGPGEARETDLAFTGGGAGKGHGMIYLNGKPAYKLGNEDLVEHVVELCEKKAAEIEASAAQRQEKSRSKPRSSDVMAWTRACPSRTF